MQIAMTENINPAIGQVALYIHVPFCKKKCGYCSFVSYPGREDSIPAYLDALKAEMDLRLKGKDIFSIYIGGGTPSLLSPRQVRELLGDVLLERRRLLLPAESGEQEAEHDQHEGDGEDGECEQYEFHE